MLLKKKEEKLQKNEKRSGGGNKKKRKSKVCGASSNSNTICINVHNRHDFYFIVSPSSQITSIITTTKRKKQAKYLTTVTITNKLASLRLCGLLRLVSQQSRRCCAAWEKTTCELCKGGTIRLLCIGHLSLYSRFSTTILSHDLLSVRFRARQGASQDVFMCTMHAAHMTATAAAELWAAS